MSMNEDLQGYRTGELDIQDLQNEVVDVGADAIREWASESPLGKFLPIERIITIFEAVVNTPERTVKLLKNSAYLAIFIVVFYALYTNGYPRPALMHRAIDMDALSDSFAQRLFAAAKVVRDSLKTCGTGALTNSIVEAYPSISLLGHAIEKYPDAGTALRSLRSEILTPKGASNAIVSASTDLLRGPPVWDIVAKHVGAIRDGSVGEEEQRLACAVAHVRLIASHIPGILKVIWERHVTMGLFETAWFFIKDDVSAFTATVESNFEISGEWQAAAESRAGAIFDEIMDNADYLMTGRTEKFVGRIFKKVAKPFLGPVNAIVNAVKIIVSIAKTIVPIIKVSAKVILTVFKIFTESIRDIERGLRLIFVGVRLFFKALDAGLVPAILQLVRILVGLALFVSASILEKAIKLLIASVVMFFYPVTLTILQTAVYLVIVGLKTIVAAVDSATSGGVRFLMHTDAHPDDWWKQGGFSQGNMHVRSGALAIISWRPCWGAYLPALGGTVCVPCEPGVPLYAPHALLAYRYIEGKFPWGSRLRVARFAKALSAYKETVEKRGESTLDNHARDLVKTLLVCAPVVLGHEETVQELVHHMSPETDDNRYVPEKTPSTARPMIIVAGALLFTLGTAALVLNGPGSGMPRALSDVSE